MFEGHKSIIKLCLKADNNCLQAFLRKAAHSWHYENKTYFVISHLMETIWVKFIPDMTSLGSLDYTRDKSGLFCHAGNKQMQM